MIFSLPPPNNDFALFTPIIKRIKKLSSLTRSATKQGAGTGADGIAISADGARLFYCPLGSRRLYSVATDALFDRNLDDQADKTYTLFRVKINAQPVLLR
ncbi:MAG: hypothetical protein LH614_13705 [Pyrinomonadaceae bacterium]|nr:hypothetical protein [Pyrinomonadaceae bacterium]